MGLQFFRASATATVVLLMLLLLLLLLRLLQLLFLLRRWPASVSSFRKHHVGSMCFRCRLRRARAGGRGTRTTRPRASRARSRTVRGRSRRCRCGLPPRTVGWLAWLRSQSSCCSAVPPERRDNAAVMCAPVALALRAASGARIDVGLHLMCIQTCEQFVSYIASPRGHARTHARARGPPARRRFLTARSACHRAPRGIARTWPPTMRATRPRRLRPRQAAAARRGAPAPRRSWRCAQTG